MSDYRTKTGPIPDDAFENDCGAPDPERTAKRYGKEFDEGLSAELAKRAQKARAVKEEAK